ncbi:conserved hypothetical protein [Uncinocarpus reesii 1704]|uniref:Multiple myeloma tumor-associated protein 2-like N-terminal domain-containing protein n=1 Tax=Uncinocarpus reesii (strain UAMH 1704) TaxID=336963 RepID=C4JR59_UNCRE|nr:uncharacterized protein UREG_03541 [Uncinocarpus reesii 1704]EEP78695.1 conserved hypothetical protein [Uncinocarpus reesii 1704]
MDLVAGVRKEGSRGGRDSFKWSDVKDSSHRENYLGHSLMAPVGRWQQGRDLSWYAKDDDAKSEEAARKDELQKIKEAEQEAMARALGLPVAPKTATGANATAVAGKEFQKFIKDSIDVADEGRVEGVKGIGFGGYDGTKHASDVADKLEASGIFNDRRHELRSSSKDDTPVRRKDRNRQRDKPRDRSRERERHQDRKERSRRYDYDYDRHERRRHRSRSPGRPRDRRRSRSVSRDRIRRRWEDKRSSRRDRSRSHEAQRDERRRPDDHDHRRHR